MPDRFTIQSKYENYKNLKQKIFAEIVCVFVPD